MVTPGSVMVREPSSFTHAAMVMASSWRDAQGAGAGGGNGKGGGDTPAGEGGDLVGDLEEDDLGAEVAGDFEVGEDVGEFFCAGM